MPFSVRMPLFAVLSMLMLLGCGENTVVTSGNKLDASQSCMNCHENAVSPGSGANIVEEWKLSHHNTLNGAGCADCHEPEPGHPTGCNLCHGGTPMAASTHVSNNPDRDGRCLKCHTGTNGLFPTPGVREAHFNNNTSAGYAASYVTYEYTDKSSSRGKANNCRKCHNPHDTTTARNQAKDFAGSAHGMTKRLPEPSLVTTDGATRNWNGTYTAAANPSIYDSRMAARDELDAKTRGSFEPASKGQSDATNGSNRGCVRCHTTTGFINYVNSGFTNVTPFGPSNPATGKPYMYDDKKKDLAPGTSGKEVTGCNACHDNGSETAYDFKKLRKVAPATVYYNYSSKSGVTLPQGKITNFKVTYPDAGDSNICVVCHSGRLIGMNIKMASARGLDFSTAGILRSHYRATAQLVFGNGGFEFYSSSAKMYGAGDPSDHFSHNDIGMNRLSKVETWAKAAFGKDIGIGVNAGDSRSHGPCIGCHMNSKGNDTSSHTYLPVNREAGATYRPGYPFQNDPARRPDAISKVVSNACAACHTNNDNEGQRGWSATKLQYEKTKYSAAAIALREVLLYALHTDSLKRTIDSEGRPAAPANWNGNDSTATDRLQSWLRSTSTDIVSGGEFRYPVVAGDKFSGQLLPVKKAAYNMGAYYNFWMMYSDPGGFAHNDVYARRLMYDAIDWLDDGKLNRSVYNTFNGTLTNPENSADTLNLKTRLGDTVWQDAVNYLLKSDANTPTSGDWNFVDPKNPASGFLRPLP